MKGRVSNQQAAEGIDGETKIGSENGKTDDEIGNEEQKKNLHGILAKRIEFF